MRHFDHNAHHHPVLLAAVPVGARTALDVGCGYGAFARALAARGLAVTAVDRAAGVALPGVDSRVGSGVDSLIDFRRADALTDDLGGPYDFVSCIAALHHMPLEAGLARLRSLVAPGGVVAVLGLAREEGAWDRALSLASVPLNLARRLVRDDPRGTAPVADCSLSLCEIRAAAAGIVPGARFRRHLYWRYSMLWTAPGTG